eukprot:6194307-Pleurochrysis_carterae.AAC.1
MTKEVVYQIPRVTECSKVECRSRVCWLGPISAANVLQQQQNKTVNSRQPEGGPRNEKVSTARRKCSGKLAASSEEVRKSED